MVVSGPSGAGKSTIVREVLHRTGARFSTSVTTRGARDGEVDGEDYHFVDRSTFDEMIERGELLEWAEVFGQLYGTPAAPVEEAVAGGETVLMDIDVQGALQVHQKIPDAIFVLVAAPSSEVLRGRLRDRGSEGEHELTERLSKAQKEIETAEQSGVYNYRVVNDDLEAAIRQVVEIVRSELENR